MVGNQRSLLSIFSIYRENTNMSPNPRYRNYLKYKGKIRSTQERKLSEKEILTTFHVLNNI